MRSRILVLAVAAVSLVASLAPPAGAEADPAGGTVAPPPAHAFPAADGRASMIDRPIPAGTADTDPRSDDEPATSVIVEFADRDAGSASRAARSVGGDVIDTIEGTDAVVIDTNGRDAAEVAAELSARGDVAFAEPNGVMRAFDAPNDPIYLTQEAYLDDVRVPEAWRIETGDPSVIVAVLDTGVDGTHPDLSARMVPGRNTIANNADAADDHGHGTMVAGIIGAVRNNGLTIAGVAGGGVKIMPVKVLGSSGAGSDDDIAEGIVWAADNGADVINLSLGRPGTSPTIDSAVDHALDKDVAVIAATGNTGGGHISTPAGSPGVIGVTATDHDGTFASFSTYGPHVDLAAPGMAVTSTAMGGGVATADGTSFAAPIVAGVAAMVRSRHPGWSWDRTLVELLRTASDRGPAGVDDHYGFGMVDAAAALGLLARTAPVGVGPSAVDAEPNDTPSQATVAAIGANTGTIGIEGDHDWWSIPVSGTGDLTVTVTPPPWVFDNAANFDPMLEIYGTDENLEAEIDSGMTGEAETFTFATGPGTAKVRVANWHGSKGGPAYTLDVTFTPGGGPSASPSASPVDGPWIHAVTPTIRATGVATSAKPAITFGRELDASTVLGPDQDPLFTIALFDGMTGALIPVSTSFSGAANKVTLTPLGGLEPSTPYVIGVGGLLDSIGRAMPTRWLPFTSVPGGFAKPSVGGVYDPIVGDFGGDGLSDVLWYKPGSGADYLWFGSWTRLVNLGAFPVSGTYEPLALDLNGDGYDDIIWYRPGSGKDYIWYGGPFGFTSVSTTVHGTYQPFALDLNGDGFDDIIWYRPGTGKDFIWYGSAGGFSSVSTTVNGTYEPFPLDLNGDGFDDIMWYRPGTGKDFIWYGNPGGFTSVSTTVNGVYRPVPGDFGGDGFDDIIWYRPGTTQDYMWSGSATGFRSKKITINGDYEPLPGDFNGDVIDDVLYYGVGSKPDAIGVGFPGLDA